MRVHKTIQDSIVDGPGLRYVVFVQGCEHHCPGCHNPDTHDPAGGRWMSVEDLTAEMLQNPLCEGLTLSGGEPFNQAYSCAELAIRAHERGYSVWTYTGYTWEIVRERARCDNGYLTLLVFTDVIVDGPFMESKKSYEVKFRGSTNQRLIDVKKSLEAGKVVLWELPEDRPDKFEVPES